MEIDKDLILELDKQIRNSFKAHVSLNNKFSVSNEIFQKLVEQLATSLNLRYRLNILETDCSLQFRYALYKTVLDEICIKLGEKGKLDPWDITEEDLKSHSFINDIKNGNLLVTEIWKLEFDLKNNELGSISEKINQIKKVLAYLNYTFQQKNIPQLYLDQEPNLRYGILDEPLVKSKIDYLEYKLKVFEIELNENPDPNEEPSTFLNDLPIDFSQKERFVYLAELQIIEFLKNKIKETGQSYSDKKLYTLLSLCCGISEATAKKLMGFYNYKDNIDRNNPFKDKDLMEHVSRYLTNNNLKL